jgi:hypothetical protein
MKIYLLVDLMKRQESILQRIRAAIIHKQNEYKNNKDELLLELKNKLLTFITCSEEIIIETIRNTHDTKILMRTNIPYSLYNRILPEDRYIIETQIKEDLGFDIFMCNRDDIVYVEIFIN